MKRVLFVLVISIVLQSCSSTKQQELELPQIFSNDMIIQRDAEVLFWGIAQEKSEVEVQTPWGEFHTQSDHYGHWELPVATPFDGYDSFNIEICDPSNCVIIENVLLGEVWLASGQSNMEMPLQGWLPNDPILNSENEIMDAVNYPVRFFTVDKNISAVSSDVVSGSWTTGENAESFSATAYFFARDLTNKLDVPVGIIHSSWGGTPVRSWISKEGLGKTGYYEDVIRDLPLLEELETEFEKWLDTLDSFSSPLFEFPNQSMDNLKEYWKELDYGDKEYLDLSTNDDRWKKIMLPGDYIPALKEGEDFVDFDGVVWAKKTFELPKIDTDLRLNLGAIDDLDYTFVNGVMIGSTVGGDSFRSKEYLIPQDLLKEGENVIALRLVDTGGYSSIGSPLSIESDEIKVSLEGEWNAYVTAEFYKHKFYRFNGSENDYSNRPLYNKLNAATPTSLFNAMIHPLKKYTIKGAIWYQGESNVGFHEEYEEVFSEMIKDWRSQWGYDFPFYFVQIAPFDYQNNLSPDLRNSQLKVSSLENTGMITTLDIGNPINIHPANKQEVGARLASAALYHTYDATVNYEGTIPIQTVKQGKEIVMSFECLQGGIVYEPENAQDLEISEDEKTYYKADVRVEGCKIYLSAPELTSPKYVRHAWRDVSTGAIYNSLGQPISTFKVSAE